MKILVINPGSTSTKLAVFVEEASVFSQTIHHSPEDLAPFPCVLDQLPYRLDLVKKALAQAGCRLEELDAISARGGFTKPVEAGTYRIDQTVAHAMAHAYREHAANLGSLLAWELARPADIPAFFVDPVSVDELSDVARITGLMGGERISFFHALNHRGMARRAAAQLGKTYENCNLVVCHLGGGVTSAAHQKGRAIEIVNIFDEGCFSMDRAGGLPVHQVVELCFSGKAKAQVLHQLETNSGIVSYLGVRDFRQVEILAFDQNDSQARLIFEALAYQLSRDIGSLAAVLKFQVDAIVLTGGMAHSQRLVSAVERYVGSLAPVLVFPGESEMLSLAQGALRVLRGEEPAKTF